MRSFWNFFCIPPSSCLKILEKNLFLGYNNYGRSVCLGFLAAKEKSGINEFEDTIKEMFFTGEVSFNDEVYLTNIRHKNSLQETLTSLQLVLRSIEDEMPEDFYSIDLMNAYEELGTIIGEAVEDDLVNEIFSKFCTGK